MRWNGWQKVGTRAFLSVVVLATLSLSPDWAAHVTYARSSIVEQEEGGACGEPWRSSGRCR